MAGLASSIPMYILLSVIIFLPCIVLTVELPTYIMDEKCGTTINMETDMIQSGKIILRRPEANGLRNNYCALFIKAPIGKQIVFKFQFLRLETPFGCKRDYIEVHDGISNTSRSLIGKNCNSLPPAQAFTTSDSSALLAFSRYTQFYYDQFDIIFTAYHRGACSDDEFSCYNGRCIHSSLQCNEHDNCGDGSDRCILTTAGLVGVVISCIIIVIIVAVVVAVLWQIRKRRQSRTQGTIDFYNSFRHQPSTYELDWIPFNTNNPSQKVYQPKRIKRVDSHRVQLLDPSTLENDHLYTSTLPDPAVYIPERPNYQVYRSHSNVEHRPNADGFRDRRIFRHGPGSLPNSDDHTGTPVYSKTDPRNGSSTIMYPHGYNKTKGYPQGYGNTEDYPQSYGKTKGHLKSYGNTEAYPRGNGKTEVYLEGYGKIEDYPQVYGNTEVYQHGFGKTEVYPQGYDKTEEYPQSYGKTEGYPQGFSKTEVYPQGYSKTEVFPHGYGKTKEFPQGEHEHPGDYIMSFRSYPSPVPEADIALFRPRPAYAIYQPKGYDEIDGKRVHVYDNDDRRKLVERERSMRPSEGIRQVFGNAKRSIDHSTDTAAEDTKNKKKQTSKRTSMSSSDTNGYLYNKDLQQDEIYYPNIPKSSFK